MSELSTTAIILSVLGGLAAIAMIIAWCFIFKKAGFHPGLFFIPGYGAYLCYKIADSAAFFFIQLGVSVAYFLTTKVPFIASWVGSISGLVSIVLVDIVAFTYIFFCIGLAKVFGKNWAFSLGLIFLFPVFLCILAFGSAQYYGSAGRNDQGIAVAETWKCPICGKDVPAYRGACSCGSVKQYIAQKSAL